MAIWRRRSRAIPTADTPALRRATVRARLLRWTLAVAACGLLALAFISARGLDEQRNEFLPGGTSAVVVLDLSLSIADVDKRRVRRILERLIAARTPVGLVVFSDVPYELLPPRTPASELRQLLRFLTPSGGRLPPNPWNTSFTAGTRISTALDLAHRMLRRDRIAPGSILLASDLQTAPTDYGDLGATLNRLRRASVSIRVVPLSASSDGLRIFESLLGRDVFLDPIDPSVGEVAPIESALHGDRPLGLLLAAGLVFVVLAAHERFAGRLLLPRGAGWRSP